MNKLIAQWLRLRKLKLLTRLYEVETDNIYFTIRLQDEILKALKDD